MEVGCEESYRGWGDTELAFFGAHWRACDSNDVATVQEVVYTYKGLGVGGIPDNNDDLLMEWLEYDILLGSHDLDLLALSM